MEIKFDSYCDPRDLRALSEFAAKLADNAEARHNETPLLVEEIPTAPSTMAPVPDPEPEFDPEPEQLEMETETDSAGVPWDERIHSSSKKFNANGTWKRRRNVPDEEFQRVMAELTGPNGSTPPPPPAPSQEPTPQQAFGGEPVTWPVVCGKVVTAQQNGTYDPAREQAFLQSHGIQGNYAMLAARQDLLGEFLQAMGL